MAKMKIKPNGYKRTKHPDCLVNGMAYVKTFAGGSVAITDGEFNVYDLLGRFLGLAKTQAEAEFMAEHGYSSSMDVVSDLSLWVLWNDAVESGELPFVDDDGTQYMNLGHRVVMSASVDEYDNVDVDLMTQEDFWKQFAADDFPNVLALKLTEKPLVLQ